MDGFNESVMVALLPRTSEWCRIELPHLTLAYVGEIPDLQPSTWSDLLKAAITISSSFAPIVVSVLGVERFGEPDNPVDVLLLDSSPDLMAIQRTVDDWETGQFRAFRPHCTIGPPGAIVGITVPTEISFDRCVVSYGSQNTSYKLVG